MCIRDRYTGGAHGLTTKVSYNYNLKTGKELKLKDLFKEGFDLSLIHIFSMHI